MEFSVDIRDIIIVIMLLYSIFTTFWVHYLMKLAKRYSDSIISIRAVLGDYKEVLDDVNDMNVYYGDETVMNLIANTKQMSEFVETFEEEHQLDIDGDDEEEDEEEPNAVIIEESDMDLTEVLGEVYGQ